MTDLVFHPLTSTPGEELWQLHIDDSTGVTEVTPLGSFPFTGGGYHALVWHPDGWIYYCPHPYAIYRAKLGETLETVAWRDPYYEHPTPIRALQLRQFLNINVLYFTAKIDNETTALYYINHAGQGILYRTFSDSEFPVPAFDPCTGEPFDYCNWFGDFAFGGGATYNPGSVSPLYLCTNGQTPSGIFRLSQAGPTGAKGTPERLLTYLNRTCDYPVCVNGVLYYTSVYEGSTSGSRGIYRLDPKTLQETQVYWSSTPFTGLTLRMPLTVPWKPAQPTPQWYWEQWSVASELVVREKP
jgi:hypothetical protein